MAMKSTKKSLVVIGASGWVGSNLVEQALGSDEWAQVIGTGRNILKKSIWSHDKFTAHNLDLNSESLDIPAADILVFAAGNVPQSHRKECLAFSPTVLQKIFELFFQRGGQKVFLLSSGAVYEGCSLQDLGYEESQWVPANGLNAKSEYALHKQAEEILAESFRKKGLDISVGRLFTCIGNDYPKNSSYAFVNFINQYAKSGGVKVLSPKTMRSFLFLPNLAKCLLNWCLESKGESITVNLTGKPPVSLHRLAELIFPEASLELGEELPRSYFGNSSQLQKLKSFAPLLNSEQAILKMRQEMIL